MGAFKASQSPRLVLLNKNIASIACGRYHSAAISNNGSLYSWGCGDNGQLGRPQNINQDKMKANSIPKLVLSLLGNVVGEISCGEHHTCCLASCRYQKMANSTLEFAKLEEIEFQTKLSLISSSKQKGRGISKKDLIKIKKWRKEEQQRINKKKQHLQISENKKIQQELIKIATRKETAKSLLSSPIKSTNINLKSPKIEKNHQQKQQKETKQDQQDQDIEFEMNLDLNLNLNESQKKISAKVANQSRASFHETTRNFLYGMASSIFGEEQKREMGEPQNNKIKNKFHARKEYDKLKLIAKRKENMLRKLDEDLAILQEVDDCAEIDSQNAEDQLRKLGMKLNTVMIKISEAERSKKTYQLNIVHIKDESQENHKALDALRRNLFLQQNLKKKIAKFRDYAIKQENFAVVGLKEFNSELIDWRNFLDFQYRHLANMQTTKDLNKENNNKQNEKTTTMNKEKPIKNDKKAKKQQKAIQRINKLKKLTENNEKEIDKLNEKLLEYEEEITFFTERFKRIYNATGLDETDKIINKFFVNKEIKNEQSNVMQELYATLKQKEIESVKTENTLKLLHNNNNDHTWREIDVLQEKLNKKNANLMQEQQQRQKIQKKFTLLKEWMNVIITNLHKKCLAKYKIDQVQQLRNKLNNVQSDQAPKDLLGILEKYIQILLDITKDIETRTFAIQPKEQQEHDDDDNDDAINNKSKISKNKKTTTKKAKSSNK